MTGNGEPEPDPELRDNENVPLPPEPVTFEPDPSDRLASESYRRAVEEYMEAEVLPYVPDAWVDHAKTKIGYEIPLTRHFYRYVPPRPLEEIDAEIKRARGRDPGAACARSHVMKRESPTGSSCASLIGISLEAVSDA